MRKDKTIYRLTIEDMQNVSIDCLNRKLNEKEINIVKEKVGNLVPWYDVIENAIILSKIKKR
jgi:tRNA A37 threonylcarbamoyladenosine dehydratase